MLGPVDHIMIETFHRNGFAVIRDAISADLRHRLAEACRALLASGQTIGRDRGADGKDGFRGCVGFDRTFLPLVANPRVLPIVVALLSHNIHLMSSHLIALPSLPATARRTIRTPERTGWHRDMYGVAADLGHDQVPRLAIKCAYYLTVTGPGSGITMFLPGSQHLTQPPSIAPGQIDPDGATTPDIGPYDAVIFENRTWHAGGLNTSGNQRLAVMMQYGYRWLAPVDDPAQHLLTDRDLTDVERQLLGTLDRAPDGSLTKGAGAAPLRQQRHELTTRAGAGVTPETGTISPFDQQP